MFLELSHVYCLGAFSNFRSFLRFFEFSQVLGVFSSFRSFVELKEFSNFAKYFGIYISINLAVMH